MKYFRRIMVESTPILFILLLGELAAGVILTQGLDSLELIPGIIVLIPAILSLRGNISSALGSRLGSYIHIGLVGKRVSLKNFKSRVIKENFYATMLLNLLMSFLLGVFAYLVSISMGIQGASISMLTFISVLAGLLSGILLAFLTVFLAFYTASKGLDPDNVLTPTVATIGDFFTILFLFISADIALAIF